MTTVLVGILGLIVGFLIGIALDDALDLYRASRKEDTMSPTRNHTLNRWLLTVVLVVNAVLGGVLIYQRAESADFTRCTAEWQTDFAGAYKARSDAAAATQEALDELLDAVAEQDREAFRRELADYQQVRRNYTATRKAKPLPALPERVCGESGR